MLGVDIDATTRERVIAGIVAKLNQIYVFPETARKMEQALHAHLKKHEYDSISKGGEFAALLTKHLLDVSHDKHLAVTFSPTKLPDLTTPLTPQQAESDRKRDAHVNCAFSKVEILDGNIGYVKLGGFGPTDTCAPTVTAAMNFVANADAVILDMRSPGGGDAVTVVFLESYLFDRPTHVNDIWTRSTDTTRQFWTQSQVPGKRVDTAPVFVLTSSHTFSAGEELAYDLQSQKRATVVGETTAGGAHPFRPERIDDRFTLRVPYARAINPITKTDWEGVGVQPDVRVPEGDALATAQKLAAKKIASMQP
jgi:C-terminal processing protease CtpA/Prc